jgi:hypothetical protein
MLETPNRYTYVGGNVVNRVDPSGMLPLDIWISAFIAPQSIIFPYLFLDSSGIGFDDNAVWHGDGRSWYMGGAFPSARVWVNIQVDALNKQSLIWNTDTGFSSVEYVDNFGNRSYRSGKASPPDRNAVTVTDGWQSILGGFQIDVRVSSGNPLFSDSPPIDFVYSIGIIPCWSRIEVYAYHDLYPWHELFLQSGGTGLLYIRDNPSGLTQSPADLVFPAIHPTLHILTDPRLRQGAVCGQTTSIPANLLPPSIELSCI